MAWNEFDITRLHRHRSIIFFLKKKHIQLTLTLSFSSRKAKKITKAENQINNLGHKEKQRVEPDAHSVPLNKQDLDKENAQHWKVTFLWNPNTNIGAEIIKKVKRK